jgi:hypothetical protein
MWIFPIGKLKKIPDAGANEKPGIFFMWPYVFSCICFRRNPLKLKLVFLTVKSVLVIKPV